VICTSPPTIVRGVGRTGHAGLADKHKMFTKMLRTLRRKCVINFEKNSRTLAGVFGCGYFSMDLLSIVGLWQ
jgi:hypothetical protein